MSRQMAAEGIFEELKLVASPITEIHIMKRKKLSLHVNRKVEASPVHSSRTERPPIVETVDPPNGLVELKIRDSLGSRIGFFQLVASCLDDELEEALKAWQARHARELPIPKLV